MTGIRWESRLSFVSPFDPTRPHGASAHYQMTPTKKPRGAPPKPASKRASVDINIRTTPATKAKLQAAAKVRKRTLSAFVLAAAMKEAGAS